MKKKSFLSFWLVLIAAIFFVVLTVSYVLKITPKKSFLKPKSSIKVATQSGFVNPVQNEEARKNEEEALKKAEQRRYIETNGPCKFIPILMYHHIGPPKNWLYVDAQTFTSQMDYLVLKGYTTISLPEVVSGLSSGNLPPKPVVLTFDDGYADMFTNAYPVLRDRGLKATFFIITQLVGGSDYLTWDQITEMAGNSLMMIGDHTLTHRALPSLPEAQVQDEILSAQNILQGEINKPVNVFAFPYGSQTPRDIKYLEQGNFVAAVSTEYGVSCAKLPYDLRRIRIGRSPLSSYGL